MLYVINEKKKIRIQPKTKIGNSTEKIQLDSIKPFSPSVHPQQAAIVKQYPHQRNNGKRKYAPMQEDMLVQCVSIGTHSFVKNLTIKSSKK